MFLEELDISTHRLVHQLAVDYELLEALFSLLTTTFKHRSRYQLRRTVNLLMESIFYSKWDTPPVELSLVNGMM